MESISNDRLISALKEAWSFKSSTKWKKDNPALGQCGVTALVVRDYLGGEILKTKVVKPEAEAIWHYYNLINDKPIDFTCSQFDEPIKYSHLSSNRKEAFADTNAQQYDSLKSAVERYLQAA